MTAPLTRALAGPPPGLVDAWRVPLATGPEAAERLMEPLSPAEHEHVARMRVGGEAWASAHGALRWILAHYLDAPAPELEFERTRLGKLRLAHGRTPHFNLAWREGLALVAVAVDREVGVDLERDDGVTREAEVERLAHDFLSPLDVVAVERAEPSRRRAAFFDAWTRHEARRKLHGLALEDRPPRLAKGSVVVVRAVSVSPGWSAAVAAAGSGWTVRVRELAEALAAPHRGPALEHR